jgi:hypothetical protein
VNSITIGADPEVFVQDKQGNIVSAIGIVPGTKDKPFATKHGFIQRDNVLAEFNIDPADTPRGFTRNVINVLEDLEKLLNKEGLHYKILSSHVMKDVYLSHHEARRFGCEPDYNVWALDAIHQVNSGMAGKLRTAGGHVHIGFSEKVNIDCILATVKACDLFLGLPSVVMDKDKKRRTLYGQAGHFRPKTYGVEYRTLSNFWLKSEEYMQWVYHSARKAYRLRYEYNLTESQFKTIENTINSGDADTAKALCMKWGIDLP